MAKTLSVDVSQGIARVSINRPDKLNSLTLDVLKELVLTAHHLRNDRTLRAVILTGEGKSFCAGLDFTSTMKKPLTLLQSFIPNPWHGTNRFQGACWAWRTLPVPVIAVVHGHCFGGGLQLAMGADFRITTPDAQWSVLETKWGLIPDMSGIRTLTDHLRPDIARWLIMSGEIVTGTVAAEYGLATRVASDKAAALTQAEDMLAQLVVRSPDQLAGAKKALERTARSPRSTFRIERWEQARLLIRANTARARKAAFSKDKAPDYVTRGSWWFQK